MTAPADQARASAPVRSACAVGVLAGAVGVLATIGMWAAPSIPVTFGAIGLHVAAAALARHAARRGGASTSEMDLVVVLAVVAPLFGPALAWTLALRTGDGSTRNAHAAFEEELAATKSDESPELERELLVRSHAQVLRYGSLEEKRNLLRQLTRIGERRYLLLLRRFLRDPEPELRLCAYAELARECQQREEHIGELRTTADALGASASTQRANALAELSDANREYGTSGLLDDDMGDYWIEQACRIAQSALDLEPASRGAQCAWALAKAELGEVEPAWEVVAAWPDDVDSLHDLARAELAFRRRDRSTCLAVAERLLARDFELPVWLRETAGIAGPAESPDEHLADVQAESPADVSAAFPPESAAEFAADASAREVAEESAVAAVACRPGAE